MQSNKTVVLGEASESESEELEESQDLGHQEDLDEIKHSNVRPILDRDFRAESLTNNFQKIGISLIGTTLLASLSSASNLANLVTSSSSSLLVPANNETPSGYTNSSRLGAATNQQGQLSPLHKTLYFKNRQFYACVKHLLRHPHEKASKDLHAISQRLVGVQKLIQDLDVVANKFSNWRQDLTNADKQFVCSSFN